MSKKLKVVLLGEGKVGKTALVTRYCFGQVSETRQQTINASCSEKKIAINNKELVLSIWDTAGQEIFNAIAPMYYRDADGTTRLTRRDPRLRHHRQGVLRQSQLLAHATEEVRPQRHRHPNRRQQDRPRERAQDLQRAAHQVQRAAQGLLRRNLREGRPGGRPDVQEHHHGYAGPDAEILKVNKSSEEGPSNKKKLMDLDGTTLNKRNTTMKEKKTKCC